MSGLQITVSGSPKGFPSCSTHSPRAFAHHKSPRCPEGKGGFQIHHIERARSLVPWNTWLSALLDGGHKDQERETRQGWGRREGWECPEEQRWAAAAMITTKGPRGGLRILFLNGTV